jgi:hypothetical protein
VEEEVIYHREEEIVEDKKTSWLSCCG